MNGRMVQRLAWLVRAWFTGGHGGITRAENKNGWGGRRSNQTGRPKRTTKPEGQRKQRQVRAYDDEWEIIKEFSSIVKKDRARAERMMKTE